MSDFLVEIETAVAQLPEDLQVAWMRFRMSCTKESTSIESTRSQAIFKHPRCHGTIRVLKLKKAAGWPYAHTVRVSSTNPNHLSITPWCEHLHEALAQGIARIIILVITPPKLHGAKIDMVIIDDVEEL